MLQPHPQSSLVLAAVQPLVLFGVFFMVTPPAAFYGFCAGQIQCAHHAFSSRFDIPTLDHGCKTGCGNCGKHGQHGNHGQQLDQCEAVGSPSQAERPI